MRLIQTLIPDGKHDAVVSVLEDEQIDFAMADETSHSGYSDIVYIPADAENVEHIVERLRDVGIERHGYMVVSDVETIVSERFETRQLVDGADEKDDRISRDELRTKARNLSRSTRNYLALTIISALVATAGLLQDSAAVVVGSMVIAPLIGPAMASCVGTAINDDDLFWEGLRSQAIGLAVAVLSATLFALAYRLALNPQLDLLLIQQIAERAHPGLLALAVALGAGIAGALSLTSGADEALVGVMIAVALMPPAASVGLGLAYADPILAVGAGVLVMVNLLSINVAGILTIRAKDYQPSHWYDANRARRVTVERIAILALAILVLTSFLAVSSWDARENAALEAEIERITDETVDGEVLAVEFAHEPSLVSQRISEVVIRVSTAERDLAQPLGAAFESEAGYDGDVVVVYEEADVERR
ncbi:TIGR00341 family protein [Haloferacaceae archaeon DSL9]